ncbi:unnamed protein product [Owenia fusiformis]|uniref:Uncharacterized protein n=1 Tax=Owenia fusiformis TaxID=6347 RepID=A0A8S4PX68_OWEFU|nr:unnamed protein product [Owenia fusiformis]
MKVLNLDQVLMELGSYGSWQLRLWIVLCISFNYPFAWQFFTIVFIGEEPAHHCRVPVNNTLNGSLPINNGEWDKCRMFINDTNQTMPCNNGWEYAEGFDNVVTEWNLVCNDAAVAPLMHTVFVIGVGVGGLVFSALSDKFGRSPIHIICHILSASIGIGSAFAPSPTVFTVLAFFRGFAVQGIILTGVVMASELFPSLVRVKMAAAVQFFWSTGIMLTSLWAFALPNWRHMLLGISCPSFLAIFMIGVIPESVVWLMSKRKHEKVEKTLRKISTVNKVSLPEVTLTPSRRGTIVSLTNNPLHDARLSLASLGADGLRQRLSVPARNSVEPYTHKEKYTKMSVLSDSVLYTAGHDVHINATDDIKEADKMRRTGEIINKHSQSMGDNIDDIRIRIPDLDKIQGRSVSDGSTVDRIGDNLNKNQAHRFKEVKDTDGDIPKTDDTTVGHGGSVESAASHEADFVIGSSDSTVDSKDDKVDKNHNPQTADKQTKHIYAKMDNVAQNDQEYQTKYQTKKTSTVSQSGKPKRDFTQRKISFADDLQDFDITQYAFEKRKSSALSYGTGEIADTLPPRKSSVLSGARSILEKRQHKYSIGEVNEDIEADVTLLDMITKPRMRMILIINILYWFAVNMTYFGVSMGTSTLGGDRYINFALNGLVELPPGLICMFVLPKFGRKKPMFLFHVVCTISLLINSFVPEKTGDGGDLLPLLITMYMLGKLGISGCYLITLFFTPELFPTSVRNVCLGIASLAGVLGAIVAPYILELASIGEWLPGVVFSGVSLIAGFIIQTLPESVNLPLPETVEDVEAMPREPTSSNVVWEDYQAATEIDIYDAMYDGFQPSPNIPTIHEDDEIDNGMDIDNNSAAANAGDKEGAKS